MNPHVLSICIILGIILILWLINNLPIPNWVTTMIGETISSIILAILILSTVVGIYYCVYVFSNVIITIIE